MPLRPTESRCAFMTINRYCVLLTLNLICPLLSWAETPIAPVPGTPDAITLELAAKQEQADKINDLVLSINEQRKKIKQLNAKLAPTTDDSEGDLEDELHVQQERLVKLKGSLAQITIGGIDVTLLSEAPPEKVDWQVEMQQILLPILSSIRELTAKPRRIEALRAEISRQQQHLQIVAKALNAAGQVAELPLSEEARKSHEQTTSYWRAQESELRQSLDLTHIQLTNLTDENVTWRETIANVFNDFFRDRGMTLLLSLCAGLLVWLFMHTLLSFYECVVRRWRPRKRTRLRVVQFAYTGMTTFLVTVSVVTVFYFRSDILLFTLSIIFIVFLMLTARQHLPHFVKEARLLLNIGAVREGERVMLDGIPYEVKSINVHCLLHNPALRGIRRLPLSVLGDMVSRPNIGDSEIWFPTSVNDFVLLHDGNLAQVENQNVDFVKLRVKGAPQMLPAADFIKQGVWNLSTEGFVLSVVFGIDYQHQWLVLDEAPAAFLTSIRQRLEQAGLKRQLLGLGVEFDEAAASSLDLRVLVRFDGSVSSQYFSIQRLIKSACVQVCNDRSWVIPFTQVTVHQGEDFERLAARR